MTPTEVVALIDTHVLWIKIFLGVVGGIQTLILVALLNLPSMLGRKFVSREVIELRLASNDEFHQRLALELGDLKKGIVLATETINGHDVKESQILIEILGELKKHHSKKGALERNGSDEA